MRWLRRHGNDRKFYLAAAAALRQVVDLLTDPRSRAVIDVVERFADGQASLEEMHVQGIILSGGPASVYEENAPDFNEAILEMDIPILGVCYGYHLLVKLLV